MRNNDVVVTNGWLGQRIALAIAKGDFATESAECAETKTEGGTEARPAVDLGAGSGDPATTCREGTETCGRFGCGVGRPAQRWRKGGDLRSIRVRGRETCHAT